MSSVALYPRKWTLTALVAMAITARRQEQPCACWVTLGLGVTSLRETKGRVQAAVIGAGRTAGGQLVDDMHRMGLDPIVITKENQSDRRFLPGCGLIFSAVGRETLDTVRRQPGHSRH